MRNNKNPQVRGHFAFDLAIIVTSIIVATALVKTDVITRILSSTAELKFFSSFVAGMFFTTVFTTAPAIVTLGEISTTYHPFWTAFFGALGAVCGDVIIFRFIRDRFSEHIMEILGHSKRSHRLKAFFKLKSFRWLSFFLGGIIIASPLPDELGIGIIGFSKVKTSWFVPLSFAFNFAGILAIGIIARSLA